MGCGRVAQAVRSHLRGCQGPHPQDGALLVLFRIYVAAEAPARDLQGLGGQELRHLVLPQLPPHRLSRVVHAWQGPAGASHSPLQHRCREQEAGWRRDRGHHHPRGRLEELRGWIHRAWHLHEQLGCGEVGCTLAAAVVLYGTGGRGDRRSGAPRIHGRSGWCRLCVPEPIVLEADAERWEVHWAAHLWLSVIRGLCGRGEWGELREEEGVGLRWGAADDLHNRWHHGHPRSWSQEPRLRWRALRPRVHERRCPCCAHRHASRNGMSSSGPCCEVLPCMCFPNSWLRGCTVPPPDPSL